MAWRDRTPWRGGGRRGRGGTQSGSWVWQPDDEPPKQERPKQKRVKKSAEYVVCSACQHWEYVHYGNEQCSKCGGAYLRDGALPGGDAEQRAAAPGAGAVPMPPQLLLELEKWAVHYPALRHVARDAAAPPPPRVPEYSEGELDRLAALEQTALAK